MFGSKKKWALFFAGVVCTLIIVVVSYGGITYTSSTEFCLSCHSMRTVGEEYAQSVHFKNASGVRAECKDCHIPPGIIPTLTRKSAALNDLYHEWISPSIDTPEKFAAKRAELAQREWDRMTKNGSVACKSCHSYDAMDHGKQAAAAASQMATAAQQGNDNCIACHKGIAHHKPDTRGGFKADFQKMEQAAQRLPDGERMVSVGEKKLTASPDSPAGKAVLMPASGVKRLGVQNGWVRIEITGWREAKGRGRVISQYPGKRVFSAVLDESLMPDVNVLEQQEDPQSHQLWQRVSVTAWTTEEGFIGTAQPLWDYADAMLQSTCSSCHGVPPTTRYSANGWIAGLKSMSAYYRLSKREETTLLKYLQTHASDISDRSNN